VIDPKFNIRSRLALSAQPESLIKDNAATTTIADSAVQTRAYALYQLRGRIDGWAEQDWYQAENDLRASKQTSVVDTNVRRNLSKALRETHTA
jgi:hypothetical protein